LTWFAYLWKEGYILSPLDITRKLFPLKCEQLLTLGTNLMEGEELPCVYISDRKCITLYAVPLDGNPDHWESAMYTTQRICTFDAMDVLGLLKRAVDDKKIKKWICPPGNLAK
jgi:hypothetical protein